MTSSILLFSISLENDAIVELIFLKSFHYSLNLIQMAHYDTKAILKEIKDYRLL